MQSHGTGQNILSLMGVDMALRRSPCEQIPHRYVHERSLMKHAAKILCLAMSLLIAGGLSGCRLLNGLVNTALPYAGYKIAFACIPEHTPMDTPSGPQPIERLEAGDTVIGFAGKPVRILQKHCYLENPKTIFLRITFGDGAAVTLCGAHRIAGIRACELQPGQTVAGRKVTAIEARGGATRSYDLLTEDAGYQINGVPVNSMIEEMNAAARNHSPIATSPSPTSPHLP